MDGEATCLMTLSGPKGKAKTPYNLVLAFNEKEPVVLVAKPLVSIF